MRYTAIIILISRIHANYFKWTIITNLIDHVIKARELFCILFPKNINRWHCLTVKPFIGAVDMIGDQFLSYYNNFGAYLSNQMNHSVNSQSN